jgi:hypothetical protein
VRVVSEHDLARVLTYPALVAALRGAFRRDITVPLRHHHAIAQPGAGATLLLMPAWTESGERFLGCKIVTVFPDNTTARRCLRRAGCSCRRPRACRAARHPAAPRKLAASADAAAVRQGRKRAAIDDRERVGAQELRGFTSP